MSTEKLQAIVRGLRREASHVLSVELCPVNFEDHFPSFEPGSHIDLILEEGLVRSYSLCNDSAENDRYVLGVLKEKNSRGGSAFIHERLRVGQELTISVPRNNFPLVVGEHESVFVAGGIGVTPILSMLRSLSRQKKPATLYYCARSKPEAAFLDDISQLASSTLKVNYHFDDEQGCAPSLKKLMSGHSKDSHFYCCGPLPMLDAFEAACSELGLLNLHIERFSAPVTRGELAASEFVVELRKSGLMVNVRKDQSILDAVIDAGCMPDHSCREGLCGACETRIIEGEADHRDSILTSKEQAENKSMMICVSRSKSQMLVLDL
ncbi:PDR/VanB family oxidoreductase [Tepidicella baoligensis]|uniref:PDR/VanB family oxidoreductase n=1 Tax=Tepidicella baoligensis TaxID=2707016 RepID=UPI0015D9ACAF|nr:PDR/VanB family oxidoreductase [Tepidicella baoligensis]